MSGSDAPRRTHTKGESKDDRRKVPPHEWDGKIERRESYLTDKRGLKLTTPERIDRDSAETLLSWYREPNVNSLLEWGAV